MTAKELARTVSSAINSFSFNYKEFCEAMAREHRTLQQSFTKLCFKWIEHCAHMEHFDARNEMSVEACRKLYRVIEEEDIGLPMI